MNGRTVQPRTDYVRSGDAYIAYQVLGEGPFDLVVAIGYMSHLEHNWEWPDSRRFYERLASFSRVIIFDRRGTGLSDRVNTLITVDEMMDDIRAVMDATQSERAVLYGGAEGGPVCMLFAATYPERTKALILHASFALGSKSRLDTIIGTKGTAGTAHAEDDICRTNPAYSGPPYPISWEVSQCTA